MRITRRERFSSAHKLENKKLNSKRNKDIFGKCNKLHGHNYEIFVTVEGKVNIESGFVIDLKDLKTIMQNKIIKKLDHQLINDVELMKNKIATTENLCIEIWNEIEEPIHKLGGKLYKIKITETENNKFEYYGE